MSQSSKHGPNVNKLIVHKMSRDAIPDGGNLMDGIKFLSDPKAIHEGVQAARQWVELAIIAVRQAKEPNPWKNALDEEIAAEILKGIEAKRREHRLHGS